MQNLGDNDSAVDEANPADLNHAQHDDISSLHLTANPEPVTSSPRKVTISNDIRLFEYPIKPGDLLVEDVSRIRNYLLPASNSRYNACHYDDKR